jgi:hypothetical protein
VACRVPCSGAGSRRPGRGSLAGLAVLASGRIFGGLCACSARPIGESPLSGSTGGIETAGWPVQPLGLRQPVREAPGGARQAGSRRDQALNSAAALCGWIGCTASHPASPGQVGAIPHRYREPGKPQSPRTAKPRGSGRGHSYSGLTANGQSRIRGTRHSFVPLRAVSNGGDRRFLRSGSARHLRAGGPRSRSTSQTQPTNGSVGQGLYPGLYEDSAICAGSGALRTNVVVQTKCPVAIARTGT